MEYLQQTQQKWDPNLKCILQFFAVSIRPAQYEENLWCAIMFFSTSKYARKQHTYITVYTNKKKDTICAPSLKLQLQKATAN